MDKETRDLIVQLCTRAGMIMEDASIVALTVGSLTDEGRCKMLLELQSQSNDLSNLIKSAQILDRQKCSEAASTR